ncbi:MAG: hypothetical protein IKZ61_01090 [Prevotella sp.]|nr:hypothetical protein [Prevotella sp.]
MKQKESMKQTKQTTPVNLFNSLQSKEFGKVRVVSNEKTGEGYVSADDLCRILELSEKDVFPKISSHLYTVILEDTGDKQQKMPFVDESGLYMMFLLSKREDAIRFQDWLNEEFLQALYEQRKALAGLKKDDRLVAESNLQLQALRYMATAKNVERSGHFRVGKDIPDLTMSHLRGWWYNPNDNSTFMLQFNCKTDCYIYENIRMNVYLTKQEDGNTEACDMRIRFLDLDDGSFEYLSYDTWLPSDAVSDNTILDYLLEELTLDVNILDPENVDLVVLLNGTMSFHRSRRLENSNDHPLIEFV